jgi:chorismate synthase
LPPGLFYGDTLEEASPAHPHPPFRRGAGGISDGEPIPLRVAFKPTATIGKEQETVNTARESVTLAARGRHDPCVLPRAVPMVEAMMALVLVDHYLQQRAIAGE